MSSEARRAFSEDGENKTHIGGQALIEGVMMRGKLSWAAAIRTPDGSIYVEDQLLSSKGARPKWMSWPLVRGCVALVDSLVLGFKALEVAANHAYDEEGNTFELLQREAATNDAAKGKAATTQNLRASQEPTVLKVDDGGVASSEVLSAKAALFTNDEQADGAVVSECDAVAVGAVEHGASVEVSAAEHEPASGHASDSEKPEGESFFGKAEMAVSMVLGVGLGVALFILLPAFVSNLLIGDYDVNPLAWNIVDGVLRVAIFILYIWLISLLPDIKRMFSYHGAEHKTIHCLEHGLPLTPENARSFPRLHVRCGTAFLVMVMILAILVYTIVPVDQLIAAWGVTDSVLKFALVVVSRIVLMPVIAGVTYEITVRWAGSNPDNALVRVVLWPGMQMQRLTTNEPDDGMLECAIAATKAVMAREEAAVSK